MNDRPPVECGKRFAYGAQTCRRLLDAAGEHLGLHRDARTVRHARLMWGDNECAAQQKEGPNHD